MKLIIRILITLTLLSSCCFGVQRKEVNIGFIYDGKDEQNNIYFKKIKEEINDLLKNEYKLNFQIFEGNWSLIGSKKILEQALDDKSIDIIVTFGVLASYIALENTIITKPVVITYDVNIFFGNETIDSLNISKKLAYFKGEKSILSDLQLFKEITNATKIAIIGDSSLIGEHNFKIIKKNLKKDFENIDVRPLFIPIIDKASVAINLLKKEKVDGVLVLPTFRLSSLEFTKLVNAINNLKLPSFSIMGEYEVEKGLFMTTIPDSEIKRAARRVALNIQDLLLNKNTSESVIDFYRSNEIIINVTVAKKIGIDIPWKILNESKLINKIEPSKEDILDFLHAVSISIKNNLDLDAQRYIVKSGKQDVVKALSSLLPQFTANVKGRIIDSNSARYSRGWDPEKQIKGSLNLNQTIYEENKFADFTIQGNLQKARIYDKKSFELDIILDTAIAYFSVLRVKKEKSIAQENLILSKANLKRAFDLVNSGQARLSEVYRWQSEVATNKETIVSIQATIENIDTEFNRLLNRPLNIKVLLQDVNPLHSELIIDFTQLEDFIGSNRKFQKFKNLMIQIARKNSPEINAIDQKIFAEDRKHLSSKRAFYIPDISAFANIDNNLYKDGAGSKAPPDLSNSKLKTSVGITISYPLFTSGSRIADKNKAYYNLRKLKTDKGSLIEKIDQRVIQSIDNMKASFESISLAKKSLEAGENNLKIVTESYSRGVVSIIDLIDAQNTAIIAKQSYYNAIYTYYIDVMRVQRSIGRFDHFLSTEEKIKLKNKLIKLLEIK